MESGDRKVGDQDQSSSNFIEVRGLTVRFGSRTAVDNVSFSVARGEQLSLLGPSGCGKTTTLRCIAGLEKPYAGEILIDGEVMFSAERQINVPVDRRELSMMFQSYAIWPHMDVYDNIAYALKLRRTPRQKIDDRVKSLLAMIDMEDYARTPSTQLSGGQQQRVALARSYAHPPRALLLDEPLSNLDARLRDQMRDDLVMFQRESGVTTVYVTHDQEEAMSLSSRVIVMSQGEIIQDGSPLEVYNQPRNEFVADFIGAANIVSGTVGDSGGDVVMRTGDADLVCGVVPPEAHFDGPQQAAVRTVYPRLSTQAASDRPNVWPARVVRRTFLGDTVLFEVDWPGGSSLRVRAFPSDDFDVGDDVYLEIPAENVVLLEPTAT